MRLALIDDNAEERGQAMALLSSFAEDNHLTCMIDEYEDGEAFLSAFIPYTYDIIFMDIYMTGMTGVEAARRMREADNHSLLVFLTSSGEHMGDAFGVHAYDYIEKPLSPARFCSCLRDCLRQLPQQEAYLSFTVGGLEIRLLYSKIAYLRSSGHSTIISCISGQEYIPYISFSELTKDLIGSGHFLLLSRGVLANMDHIDGFSQKGCLLQNGRTLPVTIRKQKQLEQIWHNYNFSKLHHEAAERNR